MNLKNLCFNPEIAKNNVKQPEYFCTPPRNVIDLFERMAFIPVAVFSILTGAWPTNFQDDHKEVKELKILILITELGSTKRQFNLNVGRNNERIFFTL